MGQLVLIAFSILLLVGEYTSICTHIPTRTRTGLFTVDDIRFWRNGLLFKNADAKDIRTAEEATTYLSNQKNGQKNGIIHHEANDSDGKVLCPVITLVNRVTHILEN